MVGKEGWSIDWQFQNKCVAQSIYAPSYVYLHANIASYLPFTKEWKEEEPPNTQEQMDTEEGEEVESAMLGR